MILIVLNY